jgi:predicted alpha/beta superfamily hydrolase
MAFYTSCRSRLSPALRIAAARARRMSTSGPHLQRHTGFHSTFLEHDRNITVYMPPGYSPSAGPYPVLYMHDGQNLFNDDEAYVAGESWRVGHTADALINAGRIEPLLIVGIDNAGQKRIDEYTPTATKRLGGGLAARYGRLIIEELKPFIDRNYATATGPSRTGLGGSSLGGLVSLYLGLHHAAVFGRLTVISPSVWWDRRVILREVHNRRPVPRPRVWVDMGTDEGRRAVEDARLLVAGMRRAGWVLGDDLVYSEYPDATHRESAWAARVGPMLEYLFPATPKRAASHSDTIVPS